MNKIKKIVYETTNMKYVSDVAKILEIDRGTIYGWFNGKKPSSLARRLLLEKFPSLYEEVMNVSKNRGSAG